MRRILLIFTLAISGCLGGFAQEPTGGISVSEGAETVTDTNVIYDLDHTVSGTAGTHSIDYAMPNRFDSDFLYQHRDSLHLPPLTLNGHVMPIGMYPLSWGGWYWWDLHKGLNVNVGASVFAQFGKHARHGAGMPCP